MTLTHDWSQVDAETLKQVPFPVFPPQLLDRSISDLATAVEG